MNNIIKYLLLVILVLGCVAMIIVGQKNISYQGLGIMLVGLCGILVMIDLYNRKYK